MWMLWDWKLLHSKCGIWLGSVIAYYLCNLQIVALFKSPAHMYHLHHLNQQFSSKSTKRITEWQVHEWQNLFQRGLLSPVNACNSISNLHVVLLYKWPEHGHTIAEHLTLSTPLILLLYCWYIYCIVFSALMADKRRNNSPSACVNLSVLYKRTSSGTLTV